jgi:hypothetical protein
MIVTRNDRRAARRVVGAPLTSLGRSRRDVLDIVGRGIGGSAAERNG